MPWNGSGGFAYSIISVTQNAPNQSGVYVIYRGQGDIVYVGESGGEVAQIALGRFHQVGELALINGRGDGAEFGCKVLGITKRNVSLDESNHVTHFFL